MGSKSRLLLIAIAAVLVVLVFAVPAMAASNISKGNTEFTVPKATVSAMQAVSTSLVPQSQVTYKPKYTASGGLTWYFNAPLWLKSITQSGIKYYTNYTPKTGAGTFYHNFQWWLVKAAPPEKAVKWQGIRVVAANKTGYSLVATVGNVAPYSTVTLATATGSSIKVTHSGKSYHIANLKFYTTDAARTSVLSAIGITIPAHTLLFTGDIYFTMK